MENAGNLKHHREAEQMNNRKIKRRQNPGWKHRKYFQQNNLIKVPSSKERDAY